MDTKFFNEIGLLIKHRIQDRIRQDRVTPPSKDRSRATLVQSSTLLKSIRHRVDGDVITVGTNVLYARIHHEGGVIRPVRAKYLAIPLTNAARLKKPREWKETWIAKGCIMHENGKREVEALYKLQKQVVIPARPYMYLDALDKQVIENHIHKWIQRQIKC